MSPDPVAVFAMRFLAAAFFDAMTREPHPTLGYFAKGFWIMCDTAANGDATAARYIAGTL